MDGSKRDARSLVLALGAALLLFTAGCGERTVEVDLPDEVAEVEEAQPLDDVVIEDVDGRARPLALNPFEFAWDLQLPAAAHTSWMSPARRGLLFVQLRTGEIQGIDIYSGITQWVTRPLPKPIKLKPYVRRVSEKDPNTGKVIHDDRLYVISGDELFAFDCDYGQLIWRYHLGQSGPYGFQPSSGPFATGGVGNLRVYVGDWEGRLQTIAYHQEKQRPYVIWQWNLQAAVTAQPTGMDELVYVGDHRGHLSCFGLDREMLWQYGAGAGIMGSPLVRGRSLYFGSDDDILYVLNRLSGEELGKLYIGAPIRSRPFAYDARSTRLYAFTAGNRSQQGLRAFTTAADNIVLEDVQTDYEKRLEVSRLAQDWFLPGVAETVASSPGRIYAMRENSSVLLAIDREVGKIDWHWDIQADHERRVVDITPYHDPSDEVRAVVVFDDTNEITAYRLFGAETRE